MPKEPILFFPYNYCMNCKMNSIEVYSWHNYAQRYEKILNQYKLSGKAPSDLLDKYGIYTMRCKNCGKEYKMVWENGIPRPIIDNFDTNLFMERFKEDSINGKPNIIDNIYEMRLSE